MTPIRVLIVDDHTLFRRGLVNLLRQQKGMTVVGEAANGDEGVRLAQELSPDVILMDVQMPHKNGIEATQAIRATRPDARIIMLTVSEEDEHLFAAVKAGARGYLLKSVEPDQLVKAIQLLMKGEAVIPHNMASKLLDEFGAIARRGEAPEDEQASRLSTLTQREREVLQSLSSGRSNKEIANALCISEHTVKIHLKNILKKLHMNNRIQAAVFAHQQGLAQPAPPVPEGRP
jgi:two-component system NarL family response regulator